MRGFPYGANSILTGYPFIISIFPFTPPTATTVPVSITATEFHMTLSDRDVMNGFDIALKLRAFSSPTAVNIVRLEPWLYSDCHDRTVSPHGSTLR